MENGAVTVSGDYYLLLGVVGLAAAIFGVLAGTWVSGRRNRKRIEEVGEELVRLQDIAQSKLAGDVPDLAELLRNLNTAVEQTYRSANALEDQSALTKQKTEAAKEIIASSRHIIMMMEDMGADLPEAAHRPAPTIELRADDAVSHETEITGDKAKSETSQTPQTDLR
ncbi:MAG: hypothetical protein AAFW81_03970 [Pseudomonadota bacterium]